MKNNVSAPKIGSESLARRHEAQEPRLTAPLIMVASVGVMLLLCLASAGGVMFLLSRHRPLHPMAALGLVIAPDEKPLTRFPKPNLQLDDGHADSTTLAAQQQARLNSYGWVDRANGIVHIPIRRAMDLILAQGLPARNPSTNDAGSLKLKGETP